MENKDNNEMIEDTENQKKPCQGECKKDTSEQKSDDWNWGKMKDMLMCWNECGKESSQDSYNMITMVCMVVIAACVLFISFSVMGISQNLEKMSGIEKYITELS